MTIGTAIFYRNTIDKYCPWWQINSRKIVVFWRARISQPEICFYCKWTMFHQVYSLVWYQCCISYQTGQCFVWQPPWREWRARENLSRRSWVLFPTQPIWEIINRLRSGLFRCLGRGAFVKQPLGLTYNFLKCNNIRVSHHLPSGENADKC